MSLLTTVKTKRTGLMATAAGALLAGGFLTMPSALAASPPPDTDTTTKIAFCHASPPHESVHPAGEKYEYIDTSVNAFYNAGHIDHGEDIWPAFSYVKAGKTFTVAAQNMGLIPELGVTGAAILANHCNVPGAGPTTPPVTTPPVTTPPVTTPPVTTPPATTPATTPAVVPPVTNGTSPAVVPPAVVPGAMQPGAPGGQAMAGNAAPASVGVSAETSVSAAPADYTVPGLLLGSGTLLGAWLALTLWMKRRRGEHR